MNELEFCEYLANPMTDIQKAVMLANVDKRQFLGVARPLCSMQLWPAVKGIKGKWDVIGKCGHRQPSAVDGRKPCGPHDL